MNSMQAAMAALSVGCSFQTVQSALAEFGGVKGRMEYVPLENADFKVLIDYAHTPDALERVLKSMRHIKKTTGRVIVLFGCGGDRDRSKRRGMGKIASAYADFVIVTSDNSRSEDPETIIAEICTGILPSCSYRVIADRREAIRYAILKAKKDDLILLAGKGHEEYELIRDQKLPFMEKQIVREAVALRKKYYGNAGEAEL